MNETTTLARPGTGRTRSSVKDRLWSPQMLLLGVLVLLCAVFTAADAESFANAMNWRNILLDVSVLTVLAVGATLILAMADFDLSIGSVLVLSGVVSALTMSALGDSAGSLLLGLVVGVLTGAACGAASGIVVARFGVPSIIVTLGMLGVAQGIALLLTNGVDVRNVPRSLVMGLGNGNAFSNIPWLAVIAAVIAIVIGMMLRHTVFGRNTIAIGSSLEALRRSGTSVVAQKIAVFALAGALYGLAGYLSLARFSTTTIAGHGSDMLDAYTAVILGGNSPFGGMGSVLGSVIGVFIPVVLRNGFVIVDVQPFWQQIVVGTILVAAVYLHRARRRG